MSMDEVELPTDPPPTAAQPDLSTLAVTLLKGVVYREGDERLWGSL
jgi:hypothetical protein